jgi:hypothetical protein
VLLQVDAIAHARWDHVPVNVDAHLAAAGIRRVASCRAASADYTLVMWIDDLQWADAEGVVPRGAAAASNSPAMLALCFRSEETAAKPFPGGSTGWPRRMDGDVAGAMTQTRRSHSRRSGPRRLEAHSR